MRYKFNDGSFNLILNASHFTVDVKSYESIVAYQREENGYFMVPSLDDVNKMLRISEIEISHFEFHYSTETSKLFYITIYGQNNKFPIVHQDRCKGYHFELLHFSYELSESTIDGCNIKVASPSFRNFPDLTLSDEGHRSLEAQLKLVASIKNLPWFDYSK